MAEITAGWLAARLPRRSTKELAADLGQLIKHGDIARGDRLPPVRELAAALGVSPSTVSSAWQRLRAREVVAGTGRGGMFVVGDLVTPHPVRYENEGHFGAGLRYDLGLAAPDPALLPPVMSILAKMPEIPDLHDYQRIPIIPALSDAVRKDWPYPVRALLAVNGGYEALMLTLHTFIQPGDYVLVEDPSPPRMLDIVEGAGARIVLLDRDDDGIRPEALATGLRQRPAALILQPGVHNPAGSAMTAERRDMLAGLLSGGDVLVVEDDGLGALMPGPVHSLAAVQADPVVHIRSYSKSHGPDLRLAVLEGAPATVERIRAYRSFGSGWTSRILQQCLAAMLTDPLVRRQVRSAGTVYRRRQQALLAALRRYGVEGATGGGLQIWVPVTNEQYAMVTLAAHGISAISGSRYGDRQSRNHIRIATGRLPESEADTVAAAIAAAARPADRGR